MKFDDEPKYEMGKVVDIKNVYAIVEVEKSYECKGCSLESFCMKGNEEKTCFKIRNTLNVDKGDLVKFSLKPSSRILSSFLIFIFPLLLLIACYLIFSQLFKFSEDLSVLLSLIGFGASFYILKLINKSLKDDKFLKPKMIRKVNQ